MVSIIIIFIIIRYAAIAFEHSIKINKAATALVTGVLCWTIYIMLTDGKDTVVEQLGRHLGNISQILFFLLGAMTIVELIDAHDGFEIISMRIKTTNKRKLLWIIGLVTFFLSAILDNLTTTIVMISLVRKLVTDKNDRLMLTGFIVIAANAGGAWSPIGDVTTTMLWIGGQISASKIIIKLIVPCLVCLLVPLLIMQIGFKGYVQKPENFAVDTESPTTGLERNLIFCTGVGVLLLVPFFKMITHLPPFMGILIGLGVMWIIYRVNS